MFKNVSKEELVVPASMSHLREVRDFIEHIGKKYKFTEKVINSFKLVVDEACTNIIRHGYQDIKDGKITVRAIIRRLSLTIAIIDQGRSFDPRQVKDPDLDKYVKIGKKGGLGIFMMRKLMDDIQYNLTGNGNELRLTKMREAVQEPTLKIWFSSLSLRRKYFMATFALMAVVSVFAYFYFVSGIEEETLAEIYEETAAMTRTFAETNWEPLNQARDIALFENAKTLYESRSRLIRSAMVTDSAFDVVAAYPNLALVAEGGKLPIADLTPETRIDSVAIYTATANDSTIYYFVAPVILRNMSEDPLGFAVVRIDDSYLRKVVSDHRTRVIITLLVVFALLAVASGVLVTLITKPFHSLADWVRQVGRGQVDERKVGEERLALLLLPLLGAPDQEVHDGTHRAEQEQHARDVPAKQAPSGGSRLRGDEQPGGHDGHQVSVGR